MVDQPSHTAAWQCWGCALMSSFLLLTFVCKVAPARFRSQLSTTSGDPEATPGEHGRKHISAVVFEASPSSSVAATAWYQNYITVRKKLRQFLLLSVGWFQFHTVLCTPLCEGMNFLQFFDTVGPVTGTMALQFGI